MTQKTIIFLFTLCFSGYFELVQCFDDRCICVDPTTGHEATETVTDSPKVAPQCGMCHKKLAFLFFAPPPPNDVPQCHPKTGNFLSMQCLQSKNECFCVNTETGQEILGSRGQKGSVKCADVDFSIDSGKGISVNTDRKPLAGHPVANEFCKLPKSIGSSCSGKPKRIQYYFDYETFECLAFQYQGCGGNANRYDTVDECWSKCKLPDFGTCSGNVGPFLEADGNPRICHSSEPGAAAKTCPPAYTCTMFAFMGLCCDKATQDMYLRNYRPTCPEGQKAHRVDLNGMPWTLIGKSCADNFCPSGSVCNKLEVFAHCCTPRRAARSVEKTPNSISTDEGIPNEITVEESLPELPTSDPVRKPPVCSDGPIRYYFEKSIATCVAYRSCWGNVTGWSSAQSCNMRRLPMDIGPCSTWRTALYNFDAIPTNPSIICDGPEGKKDCPKGYSCRRGAFFAVCCNDEVEEMWSRNLHPVCRNGDQKLVKDNDANPLLGHRCEDKFCPENSSCVQQEHLAHCCLR
uniref:Kunitz/Bovine pancreatic trypsin inhibitor domain protein n=1 Tax=Steinernema glaseri TaxID=37863 RepID=A0A1I8AGB8_9BILA